MATFVYLFVHICNLDTFSDFRVSTRIRSNYNENKITLPSLLSLSLLSLSLSFLSVSLSYSHWILLKDSPKPKKKNLMHLLSFISLQSLISGNHSLKKLMKLESFALQRICSCPALRDVDYAYTGIVWNINREFFFYLPFFKICWKSTSTHVLCITWIL